MTSPIHRGPRPTRILPVRRQGDSTTSAVAAATFATLSNNQSQPQKTDASPCFTSPTPTPGSTDLFRSPLLPKPPSSTLFGSPLLPTPPSKTDFSPLAASKRKTQDICWYF